MSISRSSSGVFHLENSTRMLGMGTPRLMAQQPSASADNIPEMDAFDMYGAAGGAGLSTDRGHAGSAQSVFANSDSSSENRIKVVVRVRPTIAEEAVVSAEFAECVRVTDAKSVVLSRSFYDDREFSVDRVLSQISSQEETFHVVAREIVDDVLRGYNGTILAYGQTGTGKTHTVFGDMDKRSPQDIADAAGCWSSECGIIPRAVSRVFAHIQENKDTTEFRVTMSLLQIYMENIQDLLDASKLSLNIREDPSSGIFVDNLTQVQVQSPADVMDLIKEGQKNRSIGATNMNKVSSRSHVIMMFLVEQKARDDRSSGIRKEQRVKRGLLTIVDLAGSERVSKSGSDGQRLEEAKKINKSLSALGNCVSAIERQEKHIPFRDSKLTRLLTDSLGGNSKTCLCATIGPSEFNFEESMSTLLFATRAMAVKNHAVINEVVDFRTLSTNLQQKISVIENEKFRLMARNVDLERELAELRGEMDEIKSKPIAAAASLPTPLPASSHHLPGWEDRERELVGKFTGIIQHLQHEIAKQNTALAAKNAQVAQAAQAAQAASSFQSLAGVAGVAGVAAAAGSVTKEADAIIDQLINGIVAIPCLRGKLLERLWNDFDRLSAKGLGPKDVAAAMSAISAKQNSRTQEEQKERERHMHAQEFEPSSAPSSGYSTPASVRSAASTPVSMLSSQPYSSQQNQSIFSQGPSAFAPAQRSNSGGLNAESLRSFQASYQ